ncbi:MAG: Arc family DNA-binding protein [Synergistaceae bacterium]|nr:Arc family DNA-binding protein [Synergistaceae bacterium]
MPSEDKVRFTLRMPPDLYEKVKESADRNKRSVAREIEYLVEKMMALDEPPTNNKQ